MTDLFRPLPAADAFQVPHGRHALRRHPALARLHAWIHSHSDAGYVTRAEAVSMLPPLILDCQPRDSMLDMCAAPGSKTTQLLEAVGDGVLVVANDMDPKRAYMLATHTRRIEPRVHDDNDSIIL